LWENPQGDEADQVGVTEGVNPTVQFSVTSQVTGFESLSMEYLSCFITVVFLVHHLQTHFDGSHPDPQNAPFTITVMCPLKDNLNIVNNVCGPE